MITVPNYTVTIYCGLREQYTDVIHTQSEVEQYLQDYVDKVGLCVTVTATKFIYKNGNEPGVIVGLLNYPRFPVAYSIGLFNTAYDIAKSLMVLLNQLRLTIVVTGDYHESIYMLEKDKDIEV
jgi:hypothetical protein